MTRGETLEGRSAKVVIPGSFFTFTFERTCGFILPEFVLFAPCTLQLLNQMNIASIIWFETLSQCRTPCSTHI